VSRLEQNGCCVARSLRGPFAAWPVPIAKDCLFGLSGSDAKPTDRIDFVNGEIVRLATVHSIDSPFNAEVVRVVHELEAAENHPFLTRDQVDVMHLVLESSLAKDASPTLV